MRSKRNRTNYTQKNEDRFTPVADLEMEDEELHDGLPRDNEASVNDIPSNHYSPASNLPTPSPPSSDLTDVTILETQLVSDDLATILRNWRIAKLSDMLQSTPKQWLKGTNGAPDFEPDTVRAFAVLSELTRGKRHQVQRDLARIYGHRYHSQWGFKKGVGRTWLIKQENIRQDVRTLIARIQTAERGRGAGDEERDASGDDGDDMAQNGRIAWNANAQRNRPSDAPVPHKLANPPTKKHRPGRHASVGAKLTELAARRSDGICLADMEEARVWISGRGVAEGAPALNVANDAAVALGVAIREIRAAEMEMDEVLGERRRVETDWRVGEAGVRELDVRVGEAMVEVARAEAARARCKRWVSECEGGCGEIAMGLGEAGGWVEKAKD
jgi:hypothetical protein